MKPPYLAITADCKRCGQFAVIRKPRTQIRMSDGKIRSPFYEAAVCPTCRMWAKIIDQPLITEPEELRP